jgi:Cu/Ag efflux protein CusF
MKSRFLRSSLLGIALAVPSATSLAAAPQAPTTPPSATDGAAPKPVRHPLKGVIIDVRADRGALVVKHEEVPGVMRAMTMLLKVDEATLKSAQKNQAITGLLVRKSDGWWLEEVKPAS